MSELNRRHFHQLAAAAVGGLMTGSLMGCPGDSTVSREAGSTTNPARTPPEPGASGTGPEVAMTSLLMQEKHVCRGLNLCKNQGKTKENACAGQGACATFAEHACGQQNECKGQGGCGTSPGENSCKGMGDCHVPLMDHAWGTARKNFEAAMKAAGKNVGPAPAPTKS